MIRYVVWYAKIWYVKIRYCQNPIFWLQKNKLNLVPQVDVNDCKYVQ